MEMGWSFGRLTYQSGSAFRQRMRLTTVELSYSMGDARTNGNESRESLY